MREFSVELILPAPPERVWTVLTDFGRYSEWHPYQTIEGVAALFAVITIRSRLPGVHRVASEKAIVWKLQTQKRMELMGGKLAKRFFVLEPHGQGTFLRHGYRISGVWVSRLIPPSFRIERLRPSPSYEEFNTALEQRIRSQFTGH